MCELTPLIYPKLIKHLKFLLGPVVAIGWPGTVIRYLSWVPPTYATAVVGCFYRRTVRWSSSFHLPPNQYIEWDLFGRARSGRGSALNVDGHSREEEEEDKRAPGVFGHEHTLLASAHY